MTTQPFRDAAACAAPWLAPSAAAAMLGYRDPAALDAFLTFHGHVEGGRPTRRALAAGAARQEAGGWLWHEPFVALLARSAGHPDGAVLCGVETPECIGVGLARAVSDLLLLRVAWKAGDAWVRFAASADMDVMEGLRFGPGLGALVRKAGADCARSVIEGPLSRMLAACDADDPVVADAGRAFGDALSRLRAIDAAHPLVRYGIVPAPEAMAAAA